MLIYSLVFFTLLYQLIPQKWLENPWVFWLAVFVALTLGSAVKFFWLPFEDRQIDEGRQRVRAAERDLEAALRLGHIHGDVIIHAGGGEEKQGSEGSPVSEGQAPSGGGAMRLTLPELWAVTHSRLDLYHDIATGQARRSFRNAQFAMVVGFALLIAFVAVALNASTTAGSVVAGSLGAVSAALAGFVSRTFVRSQEAAAAHLRAYFDQPLEFSRYLAAERVIRDGELEATQRAEILTALVQAMVAGPPPPQGANDQGPGNAA